MKKKKTLIVFFLIAIIIINFIKITKVFASNEPISIDSLSIAEKSEEVIVNSINYGKTSIDTDVTFYKLGDYVTYKVVIKNNDSKDYNISIHEKYGENNHVTYQCIYSSGEFKSKDTKEIFVKAIYTKGITDINDRIKKEDAELIITLEDTEGNEKEEVIPINNKSKSNSPTTGDNIGLYMTAEIASLIALLMVLKKKQLRAKAGARHVKGKRFLSLFIAWLIIIPTMAKAYSKVTIINISTSMNLRDKLIVTYNVKDEVKQEIVEYNSKLSELSDVNIPGYTFKGWYTEKEGGEKIESTYIVKEDVTLYAQFDIVEYTIEYDLGDGTADNPETYTVEDEITLNNPELQGYTFSGWTGSNGTGLQTRVTINKGSTGDKEYKANYLPREDTTYTVIHEIMNIDGNGYTVKDTEELHGATDSIVKPQVKNYEGFILPEEKELKIKADGSASLTYKYERKKFDFGFNNNEYVDTTKTTAAGKYYYETNIKVAAKDKTGYHFTGWSNGNINKEFEFNISEDTIVEPEYEANRYVIAYNANGSNGKMANQTLTYDQATPLTENSFSREGYTFAGWNTDPDGNGDSYDDKESVLNLTDKEEVITLYAQYTPNTNTKYTVIHEQMNVNGNGYTIKESEELYGTTGQTVYPEVKDYLGFKKPDVKSLTIAADGNSTLTYQYERKKYTLTVEDVEFVDESSTQSGEYYYETIINLKAKDIPGKEFKSWSNGKTDKEIQFKLTEDTTIKPIYYKAGYFMSYNGLNGGLFGFNKSNITSFSRANTEDYTLEEVLAKSGCKKISNVSDDEYNSTVDIYGWVENNKFYWWSEDADFVYFHPETRNAFMTFGKIETIDLTDIKTEKVKHFANWFTRCYKLKNIIGKINTKGQVLETTTFDFVSDTDENKGSDTGMSFMFAHCESLQEIDLSEFDTSNVIDMKRMFGNCYTLTSLDLSGFDTKNVKSFYWMFRKTNFENIDISSFDTSSAVNMLGMFVQSSKLKTVKLGNKFDTKNVVSMRYMFYELPSLTTIYAKIDFDRSSVTNSSNMFSKSTKLVGGAGTEYETPYTNSYQDATYAQISNSSHSGYFTDY